MNLLFLLNDVKHVSVCFEYFFAYYSLFPYNCCKQCCFKKCLKIHIQATWSLDGLLKHSQKKYIKNTNLIFQPYLHKNC